MVFTYFFSRSLTSLSLANTKVTDAAIHHLKGLYNTNRCQFCLSLNMYANFNELLLSLYSILIGLSCLQELDLGRTAVTDAGIRILKGDLIRSFVIII